MWYFWGDFEAGAFKNWEKNCGIFFENFWKISEWNKLEIWTFQRLFRQNHNLCTAPNQRIRKILFVWSNEFVCFRIFRKILIKPKSKWSFLIMPIADKCRIDILITSTHICQRFYDTFIGNMSLWILVKSGILVIGTN